MIDMYFSIGIFEAERQKGASDCVDKTKNTEGMRADRDLRYRTTSGVRGLGGGGGVQPF